MEMEVEDLAAGVNRINIRDTLMVVMVLFRLST